MSHNLQKGRPDEAVEVSRRLQEEERSIPNQIIEDEKTVAPKSVEVQLSQKGLKLVENHLSTFEPDAGNKAMMQRLKIAFENGEKVTGADANFYLHEITEATLMRQGMSYDAAHAAALKRFNNSPFSLYHQDVIHANPEIFGPRFKSYWGLSQ